MLGMALSLFALAGAGQAAPHLSRDAALQLFAAAGFPFRGGRLVNVCGQPANPQVRFVDLNGDGVLEAQVADVAPDCYARPGAHYALLARDGEGPWRVLASEDAIASFPGTRTAGWQDIEVKPGKGQCPGIRHFSNGRYTGGCASPVATGPTAPATDSVDSDAVAPDQLADDPAADKASVAALSTAERTAIFTGAGAKRIAPGKWRMCTDDKNAPSATIDSARDLNGDGRPEALVSEGGGECYGNIGQSYSLVSKQKDGRWRLMLNDNGIATLMKTRGTDNYPDILNGGPGMCFPVLRWNGRQYNQIGGNDGAGKACRYP